MKFLLPFLVCTLALVGTSEGQCPELKVSGPPGLTLPNEDMSFRVGLDAGGRGHPEIFWSVDAGLIISGQGTTAIVVRVPFDLSGQFITATVTVGGCPTGARDRHQ